VSLPHLSNPVDRCYLPKMADLKQDESQAATYDTFEDYLKLAIKEFYDRGWKNRRANFIALLVASGQTTSSAYGSRCAGPSGVRSASS